MITFYLNKIETFNFSNHCFNIYHQMTFQEIEIKLPNGLIVKSIKTHKNGNTGMLKSFPYIYLLSFNDFIESIEYMLVCNTKTGQYELFCDCSGDFFYYIFL